MKKAIIIMTKVPEEGKVKTRLQPVLSETAAAEISAAFLQDAENKAKMLTDEIFAAVTPFEKKYKLNGILQHNPRVIEQEGRDLGEKMLNAFKFAFQTGMDAVVMIGTDSPTFPSDFLEQAFEYLELETDVVLGKTEDGGFYLIGFRHEPDERVFADVEWSSGETFEKVWQNIMAAGLHLREVPVWYDVDEPSDLEKLRQELFANENARRRAAKTFEWMQGNC